MSAIDFSHRAKTPELMDTEDCDFATFRGCLVDLARVNRLTLATRPTIAYFEKLAKSGRLPTGRPVEIVDVGSGYGDMLRCVAEWAARRGVPVRLTGIDLNLWSEQAAREATPPDVPVVWRTMDVFDFRPDTRTDVVISSLFTHHLDDAALVRFLVWMEKTAAIGWFVNDLHRHELPYRFFAAASRAMRLHRFVQNDGPISITRSFVAEDWRALIEAAKIPAEGTAVDWWMPFRLCVSRVLGQ
ncbi:methyltransferase domain-containing protein [Aurantimonas aggregata]|uniref:Methyltransferase domain-containing protein n=1 Tax=Aurantimonas aggregata TaxID=2047720 RepID=A0A6L9MPJ3_9HYPH|nr:methyltransferase domain-containing protein [Aurantimonas aggregata]NDV89388.1 methyltransferase domain-containing protein [Aurantimonas aggregata]